MLGISVTSEQQDRRRRRRDRAARFPLELLLIAAAYGIAYGRELSGCSATSTAPEATTSSALATPAVGGPGPAAAR